MSKIKPELKKLLENQQYAFIGSHSAVKICAWTKKSLLDEGVCYKEKFYGISSHRCCQLSTTVNHCQNRCIFCWRPTQYTEGIDIKGKLDDPKKLIDKAIKAQQKQISGFGGNKKLNKKKFKEAQIPNQFAISLSGEPTLYPKLGELINEILKRDATAYVVSNGLCPDVLADLHPLPTNMYLSLDAPNKELFRKIDQSQIKDAWEKLNKSLEILKKLNTKTVLRITVLKGLNDVHPEQYASLIKKASPDFVEVKAYMFVGASRQRLTIDRMPRHHEVKAFSKDILKHLKEYKLKDEKKESRVVLLAKD
ncbi:4-demethylwyosine synthase TYW1 [Candidatus Woesearchaeota archaeon]|nr:4-demethylwyosine synthase TYW1 [Candidatus Woesearchaeota archaeon]